MFLVYLLVYRLIYNNVYINIKMVSMFNNTITTIEVIEEGIRVSNNITKNVSDIAIICERIVSNEGFELINMILIDMQSANMFVKVWNTINPHSKELMQLFFEKGLAKSEDNMNSVTQVLFRKIWKFAV